MYCVCVCNREQLHEYMNVSAQFIVTAPFYVLILKSHKMFYFK